MKYCINYKRGFKYIDEIDEINITFRKEDTSLIDFLLLHSQKRINIYISATQELEFINNNCIEIFNAIRKKYPELNIVFILNDIRKDTVKEIYNIINKSEMKGRYFFNTLIKDWDTLLGYVKLKPTDIYIVENLGFELAAVSNILHNADIKIRVYPNVAQSSWKETPALKKFFIRPEDITFYENYVDVIEFFGKKKNIETYYKIYNIDRKWFGKLNEIIIDFDSEIDSRFILPKFAERRIGCGKRCLKGKPCRTCEVIDELATVLEKNNLMIKDFEK